MQSIQQLEDNIAQIKRLMEINGRTLPHNYEVRRTLEASLMAHNNRLEELRYEQAEADSERIEHIEYMRLNYI